MEIFTIIASLCSVVSVPLAFYFYLKSREVKRIFFSSRSITLIEDIPNDTRLQLSFKETEIKRLILTRFTLWNGGNKEISSKDIAPDIPLKICFSDSQLVLESRLLYETETIGDLNVKYDKNSDIEIGFSNLDPGDGVVLQMAHQGSAKEWLSFKGSLVNKKRNRIEEKRDNKILIEDIRNSAMYDLFLFFLVYLLSIIPILTPTALLLLLLIYSPGINAFFESSNSQNITFLQFFINTIILLALMIYSAFSISIAFRIIKRVDKFIFTRINRIIAPTIAERFLSEDWSIIDGELIR